MAVVNRSSASAKTQAISTQAVTKTLVCFKQLLKAATIKVAAEHEAAHAPGAHLRQADHAISQQAAQVCLRLPVCKSTGICTKYLHVMCTLQVNLQECITSHQAPHATFTLYHKKLFNAAMHAHEYCVACRYWQAN